MPWPPVNPPLRAWLSNGSTATIRTSFVQALSVSPTPVMVPALPTLTTTLSTRLLPSRAMALAMAGPVTRRWYSGLLSLASQFI